MNDFDKDCENMISEVQDLLTQKENKEWISRYAKYAEKINTNLETIRKNKLKFHEWAPLYLYMNILEAKGQMKFSLRYLGQDVAKLKVSSDKITISTKGFEVKNERDFGCKVKLEDSGWKSKEAASFRRHFSSPSKAIGIAKKRNEEHRIESMFLTMFAKKKGKDKILCNIQPVKIASIARFQMPTPLSAAKVKKVKFVGAAGGGIDIMSRIGTGSSTKLCIMELKDENDFKVAPINAILQGLAYAVFIQALLRSNCGAEWWKIFGFSGKLPEQLELYVICVMPSKEKNDTSFGGKIITTTRDSFHLHYLYFNEENNNVLGIEASLKQCIVKKIKPK